MLKIYHNSRCKKSREGLKYLEANGKEFEIVEYLKNGLTIDELKEILMKLNKRPFEIVRTQEDYFKKNLKGKEFTDEEWIMIISENPKLLQRPIVVDRHKAVFAQPVEELDCLL